MFRRVKKIEEKMLEYNTNPSTTLESCVLGGLCEWVKHKKKSKNLITHLTLA